MGDLLAAYERTVGAKKRQDQDAALIETGRQIAAQIDCAVETMQGSDLTKALYLAPHLVNVLRELMATPASRHAAGLTDDAASGEDVLTTLRRTKGRVA